MPLHGRLLVGNVFLDASRQLCSFGNGGYHRWTTTNLSASTTRNCAFHFKKTPFPSQTTNHSSTDANFEVKKKKRPGQTIPHSSLQANDFLLGGCFFFLCLRGQPRRTASFISTVTIFCCLRYLFATTFLTFSRCRWSILTCELDIANLSRTPVLKGRSVSNSG